MATIVLQAAGAFIGGALGAAGSAIGAAVGALAGYALDRALINSTRRIEGPRLSGPRPFTAEEGVPIPRVYGSARMGGIMIWATRFEEVRTTRRQGGKLGPKVTEYSYFANVAFALCEGEIAGIRRIWADGREIDRTAVELRVFNGTPAQAADPLILAKQGAGNTPAYRGTAYVVLEHFALADYGNRIPQLQFEVLRPVGDLPRQIRAASLIPGATEYGLSPIQVTRQLRPGEAESLNRHVLHDSTDFAASLDELQACCPNLEHIGLVVTWFGNDLRAGSCAIRPAVTTSDGAGLSVRWKVSGVERDAALVVSTHGGGAAYGGTPSDRSVMEAILAIKARNLKVTLYPFVMMDVPAGNGLPDPHGGAAQSLYPWRGRITAYPGPQMPGTADRTAAARSQVEAFCGAAQAWHFALEDNDSIGFSGTPGDWGFRRLILHYARLATAVGGVDAFLIGSEMRGLTTLRDNADAFPFVEQLCQLAGDVRLMLGPATKISYGADWSEYFGHHPGDGTGNVHFHLDPLWSHWAVDAVGIDNYMPLSDWRDGDHGGGNPDGFAAPYDLEGLRGQIAGGEGFDWYYPDGASRLLRERTPITDGAFGKPWVFRYKDLASWWSQPHHDRIGGVELAATAWTPRSKPIWFTELGCPAVDKGPNQPNVFPDPKSSESAAPYFSNGGRSDTAPRRFIEAHARHWDEADEYFEESRNPWSPSYGGRMVDVSRSYVWAWDARPYPAFPLRSDIWSDNTNWHYGHWLNGRLGAPGVGDLVNAILADHGLPAADTRGVEGTVHGYVIDDPTSARAAIEPLAELFGIVAMDGQGGLVFRNFAAAGAPVQIDEMVAEDGQPITERVRSPDRDLPAEAVLHFREPLADYQTVSTRQMRFGAPGIRQQAISFPGMLDTGQGKALLSDWLRRVWSDRERLSFAVTRREGNIQPGAIVRIPVTGSAEFLVTEIEEGLVRKITAREVLRVSPTPWQSGDLGAVRPSPLPIGKPHVLFLDLPAGVGSGPAQDQFRVAAWQKPWRSQKVFASPENSGFSLRATLGQPSDVGMLVDAIGPGVSGRLDHATTFRIELFGGELASVNRIQMLNGANAVAIRSSSGVWEVVQFERAEETAPNVWRLSGLLRGQLGTEDAAGAGAGAGSDVVVLDEAVPSAGLLAGEAGMPLNWRVGRTGADFSGDDYAALTEIGGVRALLPLSPVHLRCRIDGSDVVLGWIRRGRIDADSWLASEVPLGEEYERYQVEIAAVGGAVLRTKTVDEPACRYTAAEISADFGTPPSEIDVTVRQFSVLAGWGVPAKRRLALA